MSPEEQKKLEQTVNYINLEHMPNDRQAMLFMNPQDAIDAIRRNEIPGITWSEEDEIKYQRDLLIEREGKVAFIIKYRKDGQDVTSQLYLKPTDIIRQLRDDFGITLDMINSIVNTEFENWEV